MHISCLVIMTNHRVKWTANLALWMDFGWCPAVLFSSLDRIQSLSPWACNSFCIYVSGIHVLKLLVHQLLCGSFVEHLDPKQNMSAQRTRWVIRSLQYRSTVNGCKKLPLEQKFSPKTHPVLGFMNSHVFTQLWEWRAELRFSQRIIYHMIQIGSL